MRKREVDHFLRKMLDFHENVSDLIVTVDRPFQVESDGELMAVPMDVQLDNLTPFQTEIFALNLLGGDRRNVETLLSEGSCDLSYHLAGKARFRVNVFSQRGYFSVVMRKLETRIPSVEDLKLPEVFKQMAHERNGIIFVTGATGSGKSTSLASTLNEVNDLRPVHIVTLEDPVEFVHHHRKATFNQREMVTNGKWGPILIHLPAVLGRRYARLPKLSWWVKCVIEKLWRLDSAPQKRATWCSPHFTPWMPVKP
jgi:twitching motility protein PilT